MNADLVSFYATQASKLFYNVTFAASKTWHCKESQLGLGGKCVNLSININLYATVPDFCLLYKLFSRKLGCKHEEYIVSGDVLCANKIKKCKGILNFHV